MDVTTKQLRQYIGFNGKLDYGTNGREKGGKVPVNMDMDDTVKMKSVTWGWHGKKGKLTERGKVYGIEAILGISLKGKPLNNQPIPFSILGYSLQKGVF